jgi:LDH2 family malate/lactate/ureidoglycolate dehydrogenase
LLVNEEMDGAAKLGTNPFAGAAPEETFPPNADVAAAIAALGAAATGAAAMALPAEGAVPPLLPVLAAGTSPCNSV